MRAIKTLISMAGVIRRQDLEEDEEELLILAMKSSNYPKLLKADIPLFEDIIQDLFPNKKMNVLHNQDLEDAINQVSTK
jgi:dynein heavy chain, axonemal